MRTALEAALDNWRKPIPAALKKAFQVFQYRQNAHFMRLLVWIGHLAFFSYVFVDAIVLPEILQASLAARLAFLGLLLPLNLHFIRRVHNMAWLESMYAVCVMLATVLWLGVLLPQGQSEIVHSYMYASVIFVVVLNLVIRSSYRIAVWASLAHAFVALSLVAVLNHHDWMTLFIYSVIYLPVLGFSLIVSWYNTRTARRLFLHAQLEELDRQELEAANRKLEQMAHTDMLTGLPNRLLMDDRLQQAVHLAKRAGGQLALLYLDLDLFKPVNDNYGHLVGDELLCQAARRMADCVRASDTVARIGGDEFEVLLPEIGEVADASRVAEKLRAALAQPFEVQGIALHISASIGIALYPQHAQGIQELRRIADEALYRAKAHGRNAVEIGPA